MLYSLITYFNFAWGTPSPVFEASDPISYQVCWTSPENFRCYRQRTKYLSNEELLVINR